jgi:hypothetical protein
MARYYFDIRDGEGLARDEEGLELPALEAAEIEAARSLADLAADIADQQAEHRRLTIEVRSSDGPRFGTPLAFEAFLH